MRFLREEIRSPYNFDEAKPRRHISGKVYIIHTPYIRMLSLSLSHRGGRKESARTIFRRLSTAVPSGFPPRAKSDVCVRTDAEHANVDVSTR